MNEFDNFPPHYNQCIRYVSGYNKSQNQKFGQQLLNSQVDKVNTSPMEQQYLRLYNMKYIVKCRRIQNAVKGIKVYILSEMCSFRKKSISVNLLSWSNLFLFVLYMGIGKIRDSRLVKSNLAFCSYHCDKATQEN